MNRIPVNSSNLVSVGYDPDALTLEVEFKNNSVYQYFDVPEVENQQLMQASSKGTYFNANIRDRYRYTKI